MSESKRRVERPTVLHGFTYVLRTGCGKLYISINGEDGKPTEVLARMGKTGGCVASQIEGIGRLISTALQYEVDAEYLVKQLKGIRCPSPNDYEGIKVNSCSDAFAKALEWYLGTPVESNGTNRCPKCKTELKKVKNNLVCGDCGFERAD
jgi:ribonucleoside-diphosphate reductase alpha chain